MGREGSSWSGKRCKFYVGLTKALVDYAISQFYWSETQADGVSNSEHLAAARKNAFASTLPKGENLREETKVLCPLELEHVWLWFKEIAQSRQSGMGISPILYSEIESWARLTKVEIEPYEVRALRALDAAYIQHFKDK